MARREDSDRRLHLPQGTGGRAVGRREGRREGKERASERARRGRGRDGGTAGTAGEGGRGRGGRQQGLEERGRALLRALFEVSISPGI